MYLFHDVIKSKHWNNDGLMRPVFIGVTYEAVEISIYTTDGHFSEH